ncbi:MAG: tetratricopeptide repeat protein [Desulfobacteraceae bacterium]|nr:tetratricopeptide repeat protein [Desulfobacteraceae bacterium]
MKNSPAKFTPDMHPAWAPWLASLFLLVITAAVYSSVRHHEFINFDDGGYVYENKHVQAGLTIDSIRWAFTLENHDEKAYWHPVTWLSHMLDCQLFGIDSGWHHLSNLFYHMINVLLFFLLLFRTTGAAWKSAFAAALFALHPVNVDSVAWIAERKNLLSTTFWMLTMLAYAYYAARPALWRYFLMTTVFTLGLMAKPMLVTLPCALLLLDFWPLCRFEWFQKNWLNKEASPSSKCPAFQIAPVSRLIMEKIPLLILSFGAIGLSYLSLQKNSQILNKLIQPMSLRISNALVSYLHYLWQMIWPLKLAVFYPFPKAIPIWQPIISIVILIIVTGAVIVYSRKKPYLAVGWLWYVGTLTPVIGIIQGGLWPQIADRWAYVPFIGMYIMIAWGIPDIFSRIRAKKIILPGITLTILLTLATLTMRQLKYWQNTDTLFQHTLSVTHNNYLAHMMVGNYLLKKGDSQQAMRHFKKALEINPQYSPAVETIGQEYIKLKDYAHALGHFQKALLFDPLNIVLFNKIGTIYTLMGQYDQAVRYYKEAIAINPKDPEGYNNMGVIYYYTQHMDMAGQYFKKAMERRADYPDPHYNMGLLEKKTGNTLMAISQFQKAVTLNPDYSEAHKSLGEILFQNGNLPEAMEHFKQVLRLSPKDVSANYNIGIILYTQQQMPEAARYFQQALDIDPKYEKARIALQLIKEITAR